MRRDGLPDGGVAKRDLRTGIEAEAGQGLDQLRGLDLLVAGQEPDLLDPARRRAELVPDPNECVRTA